MIQERITGKIYGKRRMIIQLSPEAIADILRPGIFLECTKGLPSGTRVVSIFPDPERHLVDIIIENDEFDIAEEGVRLPLFCPELVTYYGKELSVMRKMIGNAKASSGIYEHPKAPDFSRMKESSNNLKADAERRFLKDVKENFFLGFKCEDHDKATVYGTIAIIFTFIGAIIHGVCFK